MNFKKILSFCLAVLFSLTLLPLSALADSPCTVTEHTSDAMLEHFSGGLWYDIETPSYTLSDGSTAYALDSMSPAPGNAAYSSSDLRNRYSETVCTGLEIILENGYPGTVPSGMSNEEARQATANAIFFWLSEQGVNGSSTYANRKADPSLIRAKEGHTSVLSFSDSLLALARAQKHLQHGISFSENPLSLSKGSPCSGTVRILLENCSAGYEAGVPSLSSASVSGATGSGGDTLTLTAPAANGGTSYTVSFTGMDARVPENVLLYSADGKRDLLVFRNQPAAAAENILNVNIPGEGQIRITKYNAAYQKAANVSYTVYRDEACTDTVAILVTDNKGIATSAMLPTGTYYVKETGTTAPMVLESTVRPVRVQHGTTQSVLFNGTDASGKIRIQYNAPVVSSVTVSDTPYGKLYTPVLTNSGLKGVRYVLKDGSGQSVAECTTDETGSAELGNLAFGTYTLEEVSVPDGYEANPEAKSITLSYKDMTTAVVTQNVTAAGVRLPASVSLKKRTERFNESSHTFEEVNGVNFVFGLYTADAAGIIGKDTLVDLLTTDENGEAHSSAALPFGNYYIRELSVPNETIELHRESFPLAVQGENTVYSDQPVKNDMFKANIGVWLSDSLTHEKLPGGTFEVRDAAGTLFSTFRTDESGYGLSASLPAGEYRLKETAAPDGYNVSSSETNVTLTTQNKSTLVFEYANNKNSFRLERTDAVTGEPVPGVTVSIYKDGALYRELVTGEDGTVELSGIPASSYSYLDTEVPNGYTKKFQQEVFSVSDAGILTGTIETGTVEPTALRLSVEDAFRSCPFPDVEYRILDASGSTVKTEAVSGGMRKAGENGTESFLSLSDGTAEIRYLPVGEYSLVESTPAGYISEAPFSVSLTDSNTILNPLECRSMLSVTGLQVYATDASSGNPLPDIGFSMRVRNESGYSTLKFTSAEDGSYICDPEGLIDTLMADGSGRVTVYGLPLGEVWIEETVRPEGYFPISAIQTEITSETTSDSPGIVNVSSSKYIKLGLDSDWWEFPALILGLLLLIGGGLFLFLFLKKKKKEASAV